MDYWIFWNMSWTRDFLISRNYEYIWKSIDVLMNSFEMFVSPNRSVPSTLFGKKILDIMDSWEFRKSQNWKHFLIIPKYEIISNFLLDHLLQTIDFSMNNFDFSWIQHRSVSPTVFAKKEIRRPLFRGAPRLRTLDPFAF